MASFPMKINFFICLFFIPTLASATNGQWMEDNAQRLRYVPLNEIYMPGTHNAATYQLEHHIAKHQAIPHWLNGLKKVIGLGYIVTSIAKSWSETQDRTTYQQLYDGARYLDLRVLYRDSKQEFYTVHGLYGPSLTTITNAINTFLDDYPQEIIIIKISDFRHMPYGRQSHESLIQQLLQEFDGRLIPSTTRPNVTFDELWQDPKKRIILIYQKKYAKEYTDLWDKNTFKSIWARSTQVSDLKTKLDVHLESRNPPYDTFFNMGATMTPTSTTIKNGILQFWKYPSSLKAFNAPVLKALPQWLQGWKGQHPNIITVDYLDKRIATQIISLNFQHVKLL